jgi:hypothetical protein
MTTQNITNCKVGKWTIDFKNIGTCSHYKNRVCELSGGKCAEKGERNYNKIQKTLYNQYGELIKTSVKVANKNKVDMLPYDVRYAISDIVYKSHGV